MNHPRLTYLFRNFFNKTATAAERQELMEMLHKSAHDEQLKSLLAEAWEEADLHHIVFDEKQSEEMLVHILQARKEQVPEVPFSRKKVFSRFQVAAAAAIVILILGGWYWTTKKNQNRPTDIVAIDERSNLIVPGGNKAVLTLSDGSTVVLDTLHNGSLLTEGDTRITKLNEGALSYEAGKGDGEKVLFNTLSTPSGGQFHMILPDGSAVWLNASSSIRFPTTFIGKERRIELLTGEVYFEIKKDITKPFRVTTKESTIEVLGTHFNIMNYPDENTMNTTLLEGSVKILKGSLMKILRPGQQSRTGSSNAIEVADVDAEATIAWRHGFFQFESDNIQNIMRQIARWYDVQVTYKGFIPEGRFSGIVKRKNEIAQVLKILEQGGVHFKIEGKRIIVTQ